MIKADDGDNAVYIGNVLNEDFYLEKSIVVVSN